MVDFNELLLKCLNTCDVLRTHNFSHKSVVSVFYREKKKELEWASTPPRLACFLACKAGLITMTSSCFADWRSCVWVSCMVSGAQENNNPINWLLSRAYSVPTNVLNKNFASMVYSHPHKAHRHKSSLREEIVWFTCVHSVWRMELSAY